MDNELDNFIKKARELFLYLQDYGFEIPPDGIEITPLYGSISFVGRDIGFAFSYDIRDKCCECYVGRIINGRFNKSRANGGYWSSLYSFLVNKRGYRGSIPIPEYAKYYEFSALYGFRDLFIKEASCLLNDKGSVFYEGKPG